MKKLTIKGSGYLILVRVSANGSGEITSTLKDVEPFADEGVSDANIAYDAIESMILAHACAGLNIEDPRYIEGLNTAIEAISNNLAD